MRLGVIVLWHQSLTNHYLLPSNFVEQFIVFFKHLARAFEQLNAVSERVRNIHVPTVDPELTVCALVDLVVQDDEVTDVFEFNLRLSIEFVNFRFLDAVMWEMLNEASQARLYQDEYWLIPEARKIHWPNQKKCSFYSIASFGDRF